MISDYIEINDVTKTILPLYLKNISTYSATSMTISLLKAHKDVIHHNNARAAMERTFSNKSKEAAIIRRHTDL